MNLSVHSKITYFQGEENRSSLVLAITPSLNAVWDWKTRETALQVDLGNLHF